MAYTHGHGLQISLFNAAMEERRQNNIDLMTWKSFEKQYAFLFNDIVRMKFSSDMVLTLIT